jgi:hypothetical protein
LTEALQCLHMLMIRCARITALLMYRNAGENRGDCCYGNQYSNGISCVTCMAGANCSTIGTSLATQSLVKGYWRASITSTDVRQCWFPEACTSSSNTSAAAADVPSDCTTTILHYLTVSLAVALPVYSSVIVLAVMILILPLVLVLSYCR